MEAAEVSFDSNDTVMAVHLKTGDSFNYRIEHIEPSAENTFHAVVSRREECTSSRFCFAVTQSSEEKILSLHALHPALGGIGWRGCTDDGMVRATMIQKEGRKKVERACKGIV